MLGVIVRRLLLAIPLMLIISLIVLPLYVPVMPRTGKEMSVRMTNCGPLGWVTDKERGYRYQPCIPDSQDTW